MVTFANVDFTMGADCDLDDCALAFEELLCASPAYAQTAALDELRRREYSRLDQQGHVYLDYTGGGLYGMSQVQEHMHLLESHVFGNPHSHNPTSLDMTERVEQAREAVLRHFHASPQEYTVIFTPNASGAIKLVGEAYPFAARSHYLLTADNHNSVNGVREFAAARGAIVDYVPVVAPELRLDMAEAVRLLDQATNCRHNLFAFPAQSNFSGVQHPLELIGMAQARGWDVLLDAAAYAPANLLDLCVWKPDFVSISFYKIFGYPTGIGCLLARRAALEKLMRPWFAGGTISFASVLTRRHIPAPDEAGFEDGTVNYLAIPAVETGLDYINAIGLDVIHQRVEILTGWLLDALTALRHENDRPLVYLHGPKNTTGRGGTVTINFYDPAGKPLDVYRVEQLANRARISLRTGCFCNPGASEAAHKLTAQGLNDYLAVEGPPTAWAMNQFMQRNYDQIAGATRVSIGTATNFADVYRFADFAAGLLNIDAASL